MWCWEGDIFVWAPPRAHPLSVRPHWQPRRESCSVVKPNNLILSYPWMLKVELHVSWLQPRVFLELLADEGDSLVVLPSQLLKAGSR